MYFSNAVKASSLWTFGFINIFLLFLFSRMINSQTLQGSKLLETVSDLDVNKYLGNWYQTYGAPTNVIFQGYGKCLTAQYGLLENENVSVLNSQLNTKNELEQISGYAYYTNTSEPGKLTVHLDGVPVDSPYWVVELGEVINEEYQYSIISVPNGPSLWVLARDISYFFKVDDYEVRKFLDEYSFNYIKVDQDC